MGKRKIVNDSTMPLKVKSQISFDIERDVLMIIKNELKRFLLKKKNIEIDYNTRMNFNVKASQKGPVNRLVNFHGQITRMGCGCFLENVYAYGNIELGDFVSISGPGTILHAEIGKIKIGSFSSIAANVSIQEFNHHLNRPTTYAIHHNVFHEKFDKDCTSKGDIILGEDVWIGSNTVILSGVSIGRGAVVGAGSVITSSIPPYAIVVGNPAKVIKYRFNEEQINALNMTKWWTWNEE